MRKILGFVVGGLSAAFLFFAYMNLASAKDPCDDFINRSSYGKKNGWLPTGCEQFKRPLRENESCAKKAKIECSAIGKVVLSAKTVPGVDQDTAPSCVILCAEGNVVNPTGTPTPTPTPTTVTGPVNAPTETPTPTPTPTQGTNPQPATPTETPTPTPALVTTTTTPTPTPDPLIEKTCSEEAIVQQLKEIIAADPNNIVEKHFELAYLKVAYRTLTQTGKDMKSVESLIKKLSADLDKIDAANNDKIKKMVIDLYAKMGKDLNDAQVRDFIENMRKKKNYMKYETRADNFDVSAYMIASMIMEPKQSEKELEYNGIDVAAMWYQEVLARTLEEGVKKKSASSNLQFASVRIAHLVSPNLVGEKKKAPTEAELLAKIKKDAAELNALMERAEATLVKWVADNCGKVCATCADTAIKTHSDKKEEHWMRAIRLLIDEMSNDPSGELRKKRVVGGKIFPTEKWKDTVKLTVIDITPVKGALNKQPMNQYKTNAVNVVTAANNGQQNNQQTNLQNNQQNGNPNIVDVEVNGKKIKVDVSGCSSPELCVVGTNNAPVKPEEKKPEDLNQQNGSQPKSKADKEDVKKTVEASLKTISKVGSCDAKITASEPGADLSVGLKVLIDGQTLDVLLSPADIVEEANHQIVELGDPANGVAPKKDPDHARVEKRIKEELAKSPKGSALWKCVN